MISITTSCAHSMQEGDVFTIAHQPKRLERVLVWLRIKKTPALKRFVVSGVVSGNEYTFDEACEAPTDWNDAFGMLGER